MARGGKHAALGPAPVRCHLLPGGAAGRGTAHGIPKDIGPVIDMVTKLGALWPEIFLGLGACACLALGLARSQRLCGHTDFLLCACGQFQL